jgi:hypothetical protein
MEVMEDGRTRSPAEVFLSFMFGAVSGGVVAGIIWVVTQLVTQ